VIVLMDIIKQLLGHVKFAIIYAKHVKTTVHNALVVMTDNIDTWRVARVHVNVTSGIFSIKISTHQFAKVINLKLY
jgi:hypothetical protein